MSNEFTLVRGLQRLCALDSVLAKQAKRKQHLAFLRQEHIDMLITLVKLNLLEVKSYLIFMEKVINE